jgi:hypothetical protein
MPHKKPVQDEIKNHGTRYCGKCRRHRKVKFFGKRQNKQCGLSTWCRSCHREYDKENSKRFKRTRKNRYYIRAHGVPLVVFEAQVKKQKRKCAVCKKQMKEPHFDHNHATGKPRGALCHKCNVGLGHFNDSPKLLSKALKYLRRYNEQ